MIRITDHNFSQLLIRKFSPQQGVEIKCFVHRPNEVIVLTSLNHSKETVKCTCGKSSGFFKVPSTKCNDIKHIKLSILNYENGLQLSHLCFNLRFFSRLIYSRHFTTKSRQKEKSKWSTVLSDSLMSSASKCLAIEILIGNISLLTMPQRLI